jgi:uncharacterized membrane protein (DUF106 family)
MFDNIWNAITLFIAGGGLTVICGAIYKIIKYFKTNKEYKEGIKNTLKVFDEYKLKVDELMIKKLKDEKDEGVQSLIFNQTIKKVDDMMVKMDKQFNCYNDKLNAIENEITEIKTILKIKEE